MKEYLYTLEMETRDYECDIQGIVNNANYQHYLEATRHRWLKDEGFSFREWHEQGLDLVVSEVTLKYKTPLRGQEAFLSCFNVRREGVRFIFDQDIYRKSDGKLCVSATLSCVLLVGGVLDRGDRIAALFAKYL
jgi:acyl-CoA thioester hydrolase